jgi:type IV pilus assembly protein PilM
MPWPLNRFTNKHRDEIIAVDLGGRHTKAVHLQNRGGQFHLLAYTIQDSPSDQIASSVDVLAEHLKSVSRALGDKTRTISIALAATETVVRRAEMPPMPVGDMRQLLKFNSKNYLQQDLADHVFDCSIIIPRAVAAPANGDGKPGEPAKSHGNKQKVLVGAAKRQLLEDVEAAVKQAGLVAAEISPGLVGPVNAFESSEPEAFGTQAVALVDLGFRNTTISMLQAGELVMHRVVNIGGDRLTQGLADSLNISYAEAEGIKVGMASEVQSNLEPLVGALGRELRAFIDFFEHQQDVAVSQVFLSGGSARSELIVQALQLELLVPCKVWNPARALTSALEPAQAAELESLAPQLAVAVGAGISAL